MQSVDNLIERCRSEGLKATPQRIAIFKALEGNKNHPSAEDVYNLIRKDFPTVSLTTVYRTLETLVRMGELAELSMLKGVANYDPDTSSHHHIVCTSCGRCAKVCPSEAITGKQKTKKEKGKPFKINAGRCIKCGMCFEACKFKAIEVI